MWMDGIAHVARVRNQEAVAEDISPCLEGSLLIVALSVFTAIFLWCPFGVLVTFWSPTRLHSCNRPVCVSLRALESCRSLERVSARSHLFWLYKCRNPLLVPAWRKKKKKEAPPISSTKKALGLSQSTAVTFHRCHSIYPSQTLHALMKLGQTQPDENLQKGGRTCARARTSRSGRNTQVKQPVWY